MDLRARLTTPDLQHRVERLGFRGPDVENVLAAAHTAANDEPLAGLVDLLADRLLPGVGDLFGEGPVDPWDCDAARSQRLGTGVLPMLALLSTADEVVAFHRSRGIPEDTAWRSLSDLGQQVWVHRQTYGQFGLHTHHWLRIAWSGAFFWLGRLQFNLDRANGELVLSCHIPATGPLTSDSVDDSFAQATRFFAEYFGDYRTVNFHCASWLLDPELAAALPPNSNMASFQRRWKRYGEPMPGDADALFFIFNRRGDVDLDALPRQTRLQRAIIDRLKAGRHWSVWKGRLAQSGYGLPR